MKAVDGSDYDLAAHRGKWVVVNFWATWCAPCRKEMPELSALHAMRSNIEVVGLAYEDIEVPEMQSFLTKHPVTYPIVIVDPFDPPADFATPRGLPLTHLLDPQGKLAHTFLAGDRRRHRKADRGRQGGSAGPAACTRYAPSHALPPPRTAGPIYQHQTPRASRPPLTQGLCPRHDPTPARPMGLPIRSAFRRKTDLTPAPFRYSTDVSTKVDTYQQPQGSVRGGRLGG